MDVDASVTRGGSVTDAACQRRTKDEVAVGEVEVGEASLGGYLDGVVGTQRGVEGAVLEADVLVVLQREQLTIGA